MEFDLKNWINNLLINRLDIDPEKVNYIRTIILFAFLVIACLLIWWVGKKILNYIIPKATAKTKTLWDDIIFNKKVINAVSHLVPAIVFNYYIPLIFSDFKFVLPFLVGMTNIFIVLAATEIFVSFFN